MRRRSFVFLQSPGMPFFSKLGKALAAQGHDVHKVNYCGGDVWFWRGPGARRFNRPFAEYAQFLENLFRATAATDLVLFGDCRPVHRTALAIAERREIRAHIFEEGYIRPDWITLESGGTNGHSRLPRDPDFYLKTAATIPELPAHEPVGSGFDRRVLHTVQYYLANLFLAPAFPHHQTHRPYCADREFVGWLSRLARLPGRAREAKRIERDLLAGTAPFYFFPLQLDSDTQIRVHSPYASMPNAIRHVVASFGHHADANAHLIIKNHPLDNGLIDYGVLIRDLADRYGLGTRLRFIDGGDTAHLVRAARGVVVVNSTVGMSALRHGRPTIALGTAIYAMPGLTCQRGLDAFWAHPEPPDARLFQAFRRVVTHATQINGNFYGGRGLALAVAGAETRLEAAQPLALRPMHAPEPDRIAESSAPFPRAQPSRAAPSAAPGQIATT